jgi:hypothetical protein
MCRPSIVKQPSQFIYSGFISLPKALDQASATSFLFALSFSRVAMKALQSVQINPQKATIFFMQ